MNATAVYFGTVAAASFQVNSPNSITAYTAAHAAGRRGRHRAKLGRHFGHVVRRSIHVRDPRCIADRRRLERPRPAPWGAARRFPLPARISPTSRELHSGIARPAITRSCSSTSIVAVAPAGSGTVDVTVTTTSGTSPLSAADQFTYSGSSGGSSTAPVVFALGTSSGSTAGGTSVLILGSGMLGASGVSFGSVPAGSYSIVSDGEISAIAPVGYVSNVPVDVTVTSFRRHIGSERRRSLHLHRPRQRAHADRPGCHSRSHGRWDRRHHKRHESQFGHRRQLRRRRGQPFPRNFQRLDHRRRPRLVDAAGVHGRHCRHHRRRSTSPSPADHFTYVAPATSGSAGTGAAAPTVPTITGLSASSGALAGGDTVIISGTNPVGRDGGPVRQGGGPSRSSSILTERSTVVTPAESAGTVAVSVRTLHGPPPRLPPINSRSPRRRPLPSSRP